MWPRTRSRNDQKRRDQKRPHRLDPDSHNQCQRSNQSHLLKLRVVAARLRQIRREHPSHKRLPAPDKPQRDNSSHTPNQCQIGTRDCQHIAKEIGLYINHPRLRTHRHSHKPKGQRRVCDHPKRRIRRLAPPRQRDKQNRNQERRKQNPDKYRNRKTKRQGNTQNRGMRHRIAKICHPPPDNEGAKRPRRQRNTKAREPRAHQKVIEHQ